ncbi:MAG TPA: MHYT domain-containing protein [Xanthobacteraceae bacterium]|nr:MHYT domain-containing protein [Xanthobacteraceae bacterium]
MPVTHEPWLVALSLVVAVQGAFVGLSLAVKVGATAGVRRRLLLAGAAISLAVAIWAMHFVGMLAARLPTPVDYLVFPTLLSFLVCVLVVGAAVFAATAAPLRPLRLVLSAVFMGSGIASMHYIGMAALHESAHLTHAPNYVAASILIAIAASGLALWLAGGGGGRPPLLLSASALGIAIAGMHYTAMAGLTLKPHPASVSGAPALSTDLLAIVVAIVAFLLSGLFLLFLVPDRSISPPTRLAAAPGAPDPSRAEGSLATMTVTAAVNGRAAAELGQGSYGPLGGVGAPPRRPARQLPVERDGSTRYVLVDDIVAVHANAHYAYIFDGSSKLFCPLAIGEIEARLDNDRFLRVHRSHIVNIERVASLRRAGDNGIIELAGSQTYTVPVSRSRLRWLKTRLGQRVGEAAL